MTKQDPKQETTTLVPVDRHELKTWQAQWQEMLAPYSEVPCSTPDEHEQWVEWRNLAHEQLVSKETERKEVTGPLDREKKLIDSWFKESRAPAEAFKALANKKLADYELAQDAAATAARLAAETAAASGDAEAVVEALATIPDIQKTAGNSTRFSWDWEVTDINQVPPMYTKRVIDEERLADYFSRLSATGYPYMPGMTFKKVATVRPTGKRKT